MKKLLFFAFAAALCCGLTACGGDDDNNGGGDTTYKELIVGSWEVYKEFVYGDYDCWDYDFGHGIFQEFITFYANGTYIYSCIEWWNGEKETRTDRGNYILSGKRIVFFYEDGYTTEKEILILNNSELVVKGYDKGVTEFDSYMRRI